LLHPAVEQTHLQHIQVESFDTPPGIAGCGDGNIRQRFLWRFITPGGAQRGIGAIPFLQHGVEKSTLRGRVSRPHRWLILHIVDNTRHIAITPRPEFVPPALGFELLISEVNSHPIVQTEEDNYPMLLGEVNDGICLSQKFFWAVFEVKRVVGRFPLIPASRERRKVENAEHCQTVFSHGAKVTVPRQRVLESRKPHHAGLIGAAEELGTVADMEVILPE